MKYRTTYSLIYYICEKMWKEKFGNYLIDLSKYVLTAVVITTIYKDLSDEKVFIYGYGILVSVLTLITGLLLCNKKEKSDVITVDSKKENKEPRIKEE